jgi:hypothetical protein
MFETGGRSFSKTRQKQKNLIANILPRREDFAFCPLCIAIPWA